MLLPAEWSTRLHEPVDGGEGREEWEGECVYSSHSLCLPVVQEMISIACQPHLAALCPVQTELLTVFTDSQSPVLCSTHIHTPLQLMVASEDITHIHTPLQLMAASEDITHIHTPLQLMAASEDITHIHTPLQLMAASEDITHIHTPLQLMAASEDITCVV